MGTGSFLSDLVNAPAQRRAQQTSAQGKIDATKGAEPLIQDAWKAQSDMWSPQAGMMDTSFQNMEDLNESYYSQDPSKFDFQGKIEDYLDPSMQFRMNRGTGALDASAAAQGGLFSSGQGMAVQNYAQGLASEEYGKAFDRMQTSRNNAYQQYSDFLQNQQARRQGQMDIYGKQLSVGQQGKQNLSEQRGNYDAANIQNRMDQTTAYAEKEANRQKNANTGEAAAWGAAGSIFDVGANAAGSYYGSGGGRSSANDAG